MTVEWLLCLIGFVFFVLFMIANDPVGSILFFLLFCLFLVAGLGEFIFGIPGIPL